MQITGKIKKVFETQIVTNTFQKREFVVTTNEQYPQDVLIEFTQDKVNLLSECKNGQEVVVNINIRGREWINKDGIAKYFNTIQAWSISSLNQNQQNDFPDAPTEYKNQNTLNQDNYSNSSVNEDSDFLPF